MTKGEWERVAALLIAAYPQQAVTTATLQVYERVLADLGGDDVLAAAQRWVRVQQFWPKVSELRAEVVRGRHVLPSAEEAWAEVQRVAVDRGVYAFTIPLLRAGEVVPPPAWSSPVIETAVLAIGWQEICVGEKEGVTRAHFLRVYEGLRARAEEVLALGGALPAVERERLAAGDHWLSKLVRAHTYALPAPQEESEG